MNDIHVSAQVQEAQEESKVADVDEVADDVPSLPGQAGLSEVSVPVGRPGLVLLPDDHHVCSSITTHRLLSTACNRCQHSQGSVDRIPGGENIHRNKEIKKTLSQVLPQYRPRPDGDRLKKKEKYDEALRFIQELMDCDEFEDISTLRVSSRPLFVTAPPFLISSSLLP